MQKLNEETAEKLIPNYKDYPNINKSGSLTGMKMQYGYKPENCIQVGDYIYHITDLENEVMPLSEGQISKIKEIYHSQNDKELTQQETDRYIDWILSHTDTPYEEISWLLEDCGNNKIGEIREVLNLTNKL